MHVSSPIPHKKARIEIIPLIDIMFFLLASFMMVSLSQTHMKGIRVNLPAAIAPPPEDIPLPEPPPPPEIKPEYVEETTPPPKKPQAQKFAPIKAPQAAGRPGTMSISSAKALATYAPRPQYPYEARSRHVTGSGVCVVEVDAGSGSVTSASMAQSIGNPILDNAALSAFRQWRFKAGSVSKVKIPITFTMTGAQY